MLYGIEPVHVFTLVLFGIIVIASIGIWLHRRIDLVTKRAWRTERALIVFIKLMMKEAKRLHPDDTDDIKELESIVNVVLAENNIKSADFKIIK